MKTRLTDTFLEYAKNYNCSLTQAIHDRDWPMSREDCVKEFKAAAGRVPTEDEIKEMRPDSQRAIDEERELLDWENFEMGRR